MVYNIPYFVFIIFVMIVNISTYTFAPWTNQPVAPPIGTVNQCYYWLHYHGFTETKYDQDVSYFAAAFAYLLTNSSHLYDIRTFGPSEFCGCHTLNFVNYPYITLKNAEFTCEGWIDLYLYDVDRLIYSGWDPYKSHNNHTWAQGRARSMDRKISVWAALYFKYLCLDNTNVLTTPRDFCILMDKPVMNVQLPRDCPFMTLNGSKMSCIEWEEARRILKENAMAEDNSTQVAKLPFTNIEMECYELITLYGFSGNKSQNIHIIMAESLDANSVNFYTKEYIEYVRFRYRNFYEGPITNLEQLLRMQVIAERNNENNIDLLNYIHQRIQEVENLLETLMSPEEFCESSHFFANDLLNHYFAI